MIKFNRITKFLARYKFQYKLKKEIVIPVVIAYILAYIIIVITLQQNISFSGYSINDFKLDAVAPYSFRVKRDDISYINEKATMERKEAVARLVSPIYSYKGEINEKSLTAFDRFYDIFAEAVQAENSIEMIHANIQYNFPDIIDFFKHNEISAIVALFPDQTNDVFSEARRLLNQSLEEGFFYNLDNLRNTNPSLFTTGKIEVSRSGLKTELVALDKVITKNNLQDWLDNKTKTMVLTNMNKSLVILLVTAFARENCFFEQELTRENQNKARDQEKVIYQILSKGEVIVREGDYVTEEVLEKIKAHGESDITLNINIFLETALFLLVIFALGIFFFNKNITYIKLNKGQVYLIIGLALFYLILSAILSKVTWVSDWLPYTILLPTSTLAILVTILISVNAGFVFSLIISLPLFLITDMNVGAFLFSFLSGLAGSIVALKTEKRIDLIRSGFYLAVFDILILIMLGFMASFNVDDIFLAFAGSLNGFICGVLSIGFLPMLEHILNCATRFRLMELSDLNAPIFKKMLTLAPGTYNHSVFIANLAESVCYEIGANPLLARVGAYYHDIGKIEQAEYFIENQRSANKHDELKPTLSAAIIKSHVKIGIERARELNLPREVVDIIAQHHGKGLIAYFYQRAISESKHMNVASSDFSYTSSRPQTKEAAVVMLADVVEAASRTLRRPNMGKLEKFIWNIIIEKFNTGELSESNLTLNDLEKIKNKFVQIMAGHFHSRIEYPKIKEGVK